MSPSRLTAAARKIGAVVLCAAAAASLTGCDADQIGAAAVVGDERITVGELQDEVRAVAELAGTEPTGDQRAVQHSILQARIRHELLAKVGTDLGITVSEAEIDTYIDEQLLPQVEDGDLTPLLIQSSLTEAGLRVAVHDQLLYGTLAGAAGDAELLELLEGAVDELGVEVNPRYGEWVELGLDGAATGSISQPSDLVDTG